MKTKRIGSLEVSVVGLGCNNFGTEFFGNAADFEESKKIMFTALDAGVTFFDTAEEYSVKTRLGTGRSEEYIGRALGPRRNDIVLASKFSVNETDYPDERGAQRIISAVEGSLKRLGTDRIDLYQQHFPDKRVPVDEFLEALTRLVKDGKVVEIGNSNYSGRMIDEAEQAARDKGTARFVSAQNQYNLLDLPAEKGVLEAVERNGLMLLPFYPLASGLLTGKYGKGDDHLKGSRFEVDTIAMGYMRDKQMSDERIAKVRKLEGFARDHGHTIIELAISWLACQPIVASVIAGATKPSQIESNARAANWDLSDQDYRDIAALLADPVTA